MPNYKITYKRKEHGDTEFTKVVNFITPTPEGVLTEHLTSGEFSGATIVSIEIMPTI